LGYPYEMLVAVAMVISAEFLKRKKVDDSTWHKFSSDIQVIGHRGCSLNAPENTLASKLTFFTCFSNFCILNRFIYPNCL